MIAMMNSIVLRVKLLSGKGRALRREGRDSQIYQNVNLIQVVVNVADPVIGRLYEVKFDRPQEIALLIRVTVKASSLDVQQLVPDLVMNYVNGDIEGDVSFVVGSDVSTFEIASAVNQQEPTIFVKKVELSVVGSGTWSAHTMEIAPNQIARAQRNSIQVVIS